MKIKMRNRLIVILLSVLVALTGVTLGLTLRTVKGQTIEGEMLKLKTLTISMILLPLTAQKSKLTGRITTQSQSLYVILTAL